MVKYEPIPVRDLLIEMKDCAGLMIDLAYSAILFNNKELALEVLKLEQDMDRLRDLLNMQVMIAARDAADAESGISISNVAMAADKISDSAADIAHLVLRKITLHKALRDALQLGKERVEKIDLDENSPIVNHMIRDVYSKVGIDVIAVFHANKWTINPDDNFILIPKQLLIVRGSKTAIDRFKKLARRKGNV
jgi:uncharacterized protein with PhoU and TrkA domain